MFILTGWLSRPPSTAKYRARCFYCNNVSALSTELEVRNWTCSVCGSRNVYDEQGQLVDTLPEMYKEDLNPNKHSETLPPHKRRLLDFQDTFCNTCLRNQAIYTHLLAEYLPEEDDPEYLLRVTNVESYRSQLDRDYPLVCRACEPRVTEELAKKNIMSRANAFDWILSNSQLQRQRRAIERYHPVTFLAEASWIVQGIGFLLYHAVFGTFLIYGILFSDSFSTQLYRSQELGPFQLIWQWLSVFRASLPSFSSISISSILQHVSPPTDCLSKSAIQFSPAYCASRLYQFTNYTTLFLFFLDHWDYTWWKRKHARHYKLIGKRKYSIFSLVCLGMRSIALSSLTRQQDATNFAVMAGLFLALHLAAIGYSFAILRFEKPINVRLHQASQPVKPREFAFEYIPPVNAYSAPASPSRAPYRRPQSPFNNLRESFSNGLSEYQESNGGQQTPMMASPPRGFKRADFGESFAEHSSQDDHELSQLFAEKTRVQDPKLAYEALAAQNNWTSYRNTMPGQETLRHGPQLRPFGGSWHRSPTPPTPLKSSALYTKSKSFNGSFLPPALGGPGSNVANGGMTQGERESHASWLRDAERREMENARSNMQFERQRMFAPSEVEATGLEDIFASKFTIKEEGILSKSLKSLNNSLISDKGVGGKLLSYTTLFRIFIFVILPLQALYFYVSRRQAKDLSTIETAIMYNDVTHL